MATTFHPQVYRGAASSNTSSSHNASTGAIPSSSSLSSSKANLKRSNQSRNATSPPSPLSSSTSSTTRHSPQYSNTASCSSNSSSSSSFEASDLPTYGLQHKTDDLSTRYRLHPLSSPTRDDGSPNPKIYCITASEYSDLVNNHSQIKLDSESILFPWLHGADVKNTAQAENFGFRNGQFQHVPRYRGLLTIAAHGPRKPQDDDEDLDDEEEEGLPISEDCAASSSSSSSNSKQSCESIFVDSSLAKEEQEQTNHFTTFTTSSTSTSTTPSAITPPHARNTTSASISTSFSTDSFCSSCSALEINRHFCNSSLSTTASSSMGNTTNSSSSSNSVFSSSYSQTCSSAASSIHSIRTKNSESSPLSQHQQCCGCACGGAYSSSRIMTRESSVCMTEAEEEEEEEDGGHQCHKEIDTPPSSVVSSASSEHGEEKVKNDGSAESNDQTSSPNDIPQQRSRRPYGPENYTSLLVNSHHPHEILAYDSSYDELRRQAIERAQAQAEFDGYDQKEENDEEDIQFDDAEAVCFQIHAIPANTVSFRHFRLQKFKYASISDVVVYHRSGSGRGSGKHQDRDGGHEGYDEAFEVARKVSVAQRKMLELRRSRGEVDALEYNVFVVVDDFSVFERDFPHLVAVDSRAWPSEHRVNFVDKEHDEMRKLTEASPIGENVYLGNTFDVPLPQSKNCDSGIEEEDIAARSDVSSSFLSSCERLRRSPSLYSLDNQQRQQQQYPQDQQQAASPSSDESNKSVENPNKYSICIEARDMAAMCTTRNLREREQYLDDLQRQFLIERELASIRNTGLRSAPAVVPVSQNLSQQQQQQQKQSTNGNTSRAARRHHQRMQSKKRNSAFWFSSSSSSSSSYDDSSSTTGSASSDASGLEDEQNERHLGHDDDEEEIEVLPSVEIPGPRGEDEDMSDFDDFAGGDADITISHHGQSFSSSRTSKRSVSPAPLSAPLCTTTTTTSSANLSSSTPIKLKYKQSKSLRIAREQEEAKKAAARALANVGEEGTKGAVIAPDVLEVTTDEIIHMECLATAQPFNQASVPAMVDCMMEYIVWLRTQARPHLRTSKDLQRACATAHKNLHDSNGLPAGQHRREGRLPRSQFCGALSSSASLSAPFEPMARRILIHCVDGYTDSSVLALAYIMYDRAITLPEAYLYLQNDCNRSFFVYQSDMPFLTAIEKRIQLVIRSQGRERFNDDIPLAEQRAILEAERREKERLAESAANAAATAAERSSGFSVGLGRGVSAVTREMARSLLPRPGLFSRSSSKDSTSSTATMKAAANNGNSGSCTPTSANLSAMPRGPASRSSSLPAGSGNNNNNNNFLSPHSTMAHQKQYLQQQQSNNDAVPHAWFYDDRFDGHFPSRILDYLYLGNLGHASNALMLRELGITHVLSIGESALIPPSKQCAPSSPSSAARARTPTNSLWLEHSLGNITVMDIQDINDDGVDTILPHLVSGMRFIESARAAGGKCLVHCRVGVSRSATVVIGQVMKDLDMSLAEAYLMVRARRLNILIQPTVLFMHTLWTWEEQIRASALVDAKGTASFKRSNRMCWPVLATEMANLNSKYLNC